MIAYTQISSEYCRFQEVFSSTSCQLHMTFLFCIKYLTWRLLSFGCLVLNDYTPRDPSHHQDQDGDVTNREHRAPCLYPVVCVSTIHFSTMIHLIIRIISIWRCNRTPRFYPLCVFKCVLELPACEDVKSHWLHMSR